MWRNVFTPPPKGREIPRTPVKTISEQIAAQKRKEKARKMKEELKKLVHQRGAVKGTLTRVRTALEHSAARPNPNIENLHFLQIHMDIVTRCYDEYNTFQNLIHALPLSDNLRTEHEEKYVEFESLYTDSRQAEYTHRACHEAGSSSCAERVCGRPPTSRAPQPSGVASPAADLRRVV